MNNLTRCLEEGIDHEESAAIREQVPGGCKFSDVEIHRMWEIFSRDNCATYLIISEDTLADFATWIRE